ncbi:uncharacterized protein Dana_GF16077 [Drosophila ananassae]|uniref:LRRCT domain-containing protein n=1 Tax=Drosophila ananassae TaxID=7217 RepID=B3M155_DROAN|nr:uncharacterized protein Dana_GF16077 [Drosophila ananassae]
MFKSKSFDLVNEEKTKKPERLYQPRRMRWLKYIILPAIFAFAVLLVLCNVDFSNCAEDIVYIQEKDQDGERTSLYVSNYKFENETLDRSFLSGSFRLKQLTLEECRLSRIQNGVFQQNSTHNLLVLKLLNVQLESLSHLSLKGLQSLEDFTLTNEYDSFRARRFLSPVSSTLVNASIHQQFGETTYSVSDFLGNKIYTSLKLLDLSGTNLGGEINDDSFENLVALERLILKNCGLTQVDAFPSRFHSVQYLDLSGNMFKDPDVSCQIPYTYCLLPDDTETSPLNCRSHKISMGCEHKNVSWINNHIGLMIGLGLVAVIVGCLLGMLIMYATLHQKPSLLRGSKHLIHANQDSKSMYLIPTKGKDDPYSHVGSRLSIVDNHEYIAAYHRYLEQANIRQTESNRYTRPPRERAPSVPLCAETPPALPARITYEYESLELYEELH